MAESTFERSTAAGIYYHVQQQNVGIWKATNSCFIFATTARSPAVRPLVALLFFLFACESRSQETAVIPYDKIAELLDLTAGLKTKDKISVSVRVSPGKPASPVQLQIQSKTGVIPLKLTAGGEFVDFPLTKALRRENPRVSSNQPKGTMSLNLAMAINYSGKLTENVAWYRDALDQVNTAIGKQAGWLSFAAPNLKAIQFKFDAGTNAIVILKSGGQEKLFRADEKGIVRLDLDKEGKARDAQIILPQEPNTILPDWSQAQK